MAPLRLRVVKAHGETAPARPRRHLRAVPRHVPQPILRLVPPPPHNPKPRFEPYAAILFVIALAASLLSFSGLFGLSQSSAWTFAGLAGLFCLAGPRRRASQPGASGSR